MIKEDGESLVFLLGVPRSGTTLLSHLLNRHPAIAVPPEPWIMLALSGVGAVPASHPAESKLLGQAFEDFSSKLDLDAAKAKFARTLYNNFLQIHEKKILVDKTPRYYHIIDEIKRIFPAAKYIFIKRNPLAVAASYKTTWKFDIESAVERQPDDPLLFDLAFGYRRLVDFCESPNTTIKVLAYEKLVEAPADCLSDVFEFLGVSNDDVDTSIDPADPMLSSTQLGDKKILATTGVHKRSLGDWETVLTPAEKQIIFEMIGDELLNRLGYVDVARKLRANGSMPPIPGRTYAAQRAASICYHARLDQMRLTTRIGERSQAISEALKIASAHPEDATQAAGSWPETAERQAAEILPPRPTFAEQQDQIDHLDRRLRWALERLRTTEILADRKRWRTLRGRAFFWSKWLAKAIWFRGSPSRPAEPGRLPRFTIVTPVLNAAETIAETVESVLSQDYPHLEYIVVDGGSTDGTLEILQRYAHRLTVVSGPDRGMYDAIGKGFDLATGDVLAYLNADDVYEHGALHRAGRHFQRHPGDQVIYFEDTVTLQGWRFPNKRQPLVDFVRLLRGHILFQDGVFFRRRAYNFVGGINRSMKYAGDWDLWVRLAYKFRLRRLSGHVSSFRVRDAQLSQNMVAYWAEVEQSRSAIVAQAPRVEIWLRAPGFWWRRVLDGIERCLLALNLRRRLLYPMNFSETPPRGRPPLYAPRQPRCPLTDTAPSELLFSSRDTRFDNDLINYIYYHPVSHSTSTYPPVETAMLKELHAEHYNKHDPKILAPPPGAGSPYRGFTGKRPLLRRLAALQIPLSVRRRFSNWNDRTCEEFLAAISGQVPTRSGPIRILDVGCFDGSLLDRLSASGGWETYGIEPNETAAAMARRKGHHVWSIGVEDAPSVLPQQMRFDVVFLAQTIEHLNDPMGMVQNLRSFLAADGLLVMSTPNLDSAQIDLFGPTWSHWHPPYHRFIFSRKSMKLLAKVTQLRLVRCQTWSHPSWSWLSIRLNRLGLAASVPHGMKDLDPDVSAAESLVILSRLLYDWRGKGDYMYAVMKKDFRG